MTGMFRSHVTTSGLSSSTRSSASRPSRATPTTSTKGLRLSICDTTLRTYAESSTTSARTMSAIDVLPWPDRRLHIHEGTPDLFELERGGDLQQRFRRADAQEAGGGHQPRELADHLAHPRLGKVDEYVAAHDDRDARA